MQFQQFRQCGPSKYGKMSVRPVELGLFPPKGEEILRRIPQTLPETSQRFDEIPASGPAVTCRVLPGLLGFQ